MGFFDQMGGGAPSAPAASPSPLASLMSGDPRQLAELLQAGQKAGGPRAMMPQLAPSSNPALAQMQQMIAANPSDPSSFLRALLAMDQGQFQRLLATLSAGVPGGAGLPLQPMGTNV